ncbi:cryptochrome/photolyase family protein [Devosia sp.]|uniref:cryptochrome/photolyase family protein n=1 Tax=Devosia sp. TaxID=1871048 RepID=UPI003A8DE8EB
MTQNAIIWLRNDLRVTDNPALRAAVAHGPTTAIYIEETDASLRQRGAASRWWLHQSLKVLARDLAERGVALETLRGPAEQTVLDAVDRHDAAAVFWNRRYAPAERALDARIKTALHDAGVTAESYPGNVLVEPFDIETGGGKPYSVYSPFWKALKGRDIPTPQRRPDRHEAIDAPSVDTDYTAPSWSAKLADHWQIGEAAAQDRLDHFLEELVADYPDGRDIPAKDVTSRLSPHLAFGEISARQIWHTAQTVAQAHPEKASAIDKFLSELAWRDFNHVQLYHREDIATVPMVDKYAAMEWRDDPDGLEAWQKGRTGLPIVDAGMRELWETGVMHNRVRMLAASLLVKNMMIDWRLGERWFWDTLVDADAASNPGNWQWVAGSGLDAAPYFRIFNPVVQGERFDPAGDYVRRWVPEVKDLPDKWVHKPAEAPEDVKRKIAGDYPAPIVDLKASRERALAAMKAL